MGHFQIKKIFLWELVFWEAGLKFITVKTDLQTNLTYSGTFGKLYWRNLEFTGIIEEFVGMFCDILNYARSFQKR